MVQCLRLHLPMQGVWVQPLGRELKKSNHEKQKLYGNKFNQDFKKGNTWIQDFPGGPAVKNPPFNAGDMV